jgi:RND family efflux transporter MFP subunit
MPFWKSKSPAIEPSLPAKRRSLKPVLFSLVAVVAVGSLVAFRVYSARKEEPAKAAAPVLEFAKADIAVVELRALTRTLPISGSLSPVVQSTVRSKVPGEIRRVLVREGERVALGQLLAEIDTVDLQARLDAQVAALEEAKARLSIAVKNRDNAQQLHKQGFISQNAFDTTQSGFEAAAAAVKSAEAQVRLARNATQDAIVRAPIAGIIAKKMINAGEKVGVDSPVVTIVDLAKMEIEAPAPSSEVPGLKIGQSARFRVDGFGERAFDGRLERINPTTEPGSRSITLYLSVSNQDGVLKGGMFAKGSLILDKSEPAPVIPASAVQEEAGQTFVFTVEGGKVGRRAVKLGLREEQSGFVEVVSGLEKGVAVVSARTIGLKAGAAATVKDSAAPPAAKPNQG